MIYLLKQVLIMLESVQDDMNSDIFDLLSSKNTNDPNNTCATRYGSQVSHDTIQALDSYVYYLETMEHFVTDDEFNAWKVFSDNWFNMYFEPSMVMDDIANIHGDPYEIYCDLST